MDICDERDFLLTNKSHAHNRAIYPLANSPTKSLGMILVTSIENTMKIEYRDDAKISIALAIDLYKKSTLGERRPIDRPDIFEGMLNNANLTISAWHELRLVGIARSLTDFTYVTYLADLAVDAEYQKQGIGEQLIQETRRRLGRDCMIVLLAAPKANDYYPKLGFEHNPRAWTLKGNQPLQK